MWNLRLQCLVPKYPRCWDFISLALVQNTIARSLYANKTECWCASVYLASEDLRIPGCVPDPLGQLTIVLRAIQVPFMQVVVIRVNGRNRLIYCATRVMHVPLGNGTPQKRTHDLDHMRRHCAAPRIRGRKGCSTRALVNTGLCPRPLGPRALAAVL